VIFHPFFSYRKEDKTMFELTIKGKVYNFNFGMGFLREINKTITTPIDGLKNVDKNIGLRYHIAGIIDGDLEALCIILDTANKGFNPRLSKQDLDAFIDDESTDIDELFVTVLDFLKQANATKKTVADLQEAAEEQKAKAAAEA
jgi:hypothetical protein